MKLLFVCLGNICRSPTAEAVMRSLLAEEGLKGAVVVDSAGTGNWHVGHPPDDRAVSAAGSRGIEVAGQAREVEEADFATFDLILAMDYENHAELDARAPASDSRASVRLLREYDVDAVAANELEVPDPYYGGADGFDDVLELITRACRGLLETEVRPRAR